MSVRSLLFGLLLVSGNDCANVLAEVGAGSIPVFVEELNDFLKKIGCKNTHFSNPHGLHDASHVTTAFDLGLIASRAMQDSRFRDIVSHKSYINPSTNLSDERFLHQSNALLQRGRYFYPQAIGVKTGFTSFAGYNLIAAAEKDGRTLIAVILGTSQRLERYRDAIRLFRAAFEQKKIHQKLLSENATFTKNVEGASGFLSARLSEDLVLSYYPAEEPSKLVTQLTWNNVSLPIKKGQIVGQVEILDESQHLVMSAPVFSDHDVNASLWWKVIERMYQFFCWLSKSVTHS